MSLFDLLGLVLVLLGILGLVGVLPFGLLVSIIFIVAGIACFAYGRGAFVR